jgi:RNA-directed DNA polymerase
MAEAQPYDVPKQVVWDAVGLDWKSRMRRESHVRFREGLGVKFPRATRLVIVCKTRRALDEAERRVRAILTRLGLELHPEKTRKLDLSWGKEGFDFLGCHLRKRLSGSTLENKGRRLYFLQRWPSQRSMKRVRQRVKELTPRRRCHEDLRNVITDLNPVLRGWANYFRTGNAARKFNRVDTYVWQRLRSLRVKRAGRSLKPGQWKAWDRDLFYSLGLVRLRGTVQYPEAA